jgi:hypothetical protein
VAAAEAVFDSNLDAGGCAARDRAATEVAAVSGAINHLGWPP